MSTSTTPERVTGEDKFGKFTLDFRIAEAFCDCCGRKVSVRVRYDVQTIRLPDGIKVGDTIVHNPSRMAVGITCGCYAKFHRQVVHIQERMKHRK